MEKRAGGFGFWAVTIALALVAAFCCTGTVMSRSSLSVREQEEYYRERERQLVSETREFLRTEGFENSGIMLTRIVEADGSRRYTMTVHHGRIDRMCEEERRELMGKLEAFAFEDKACTFLHNFLLSD